MKNRIYDIMHRTATLSLVAVTLTGAFFTARGSYGIISRRIEYGNKIAAEEKKAAEGK